MRRFSTKYVLRSAVAMLIVAAMASCSSHKSVSSSRSHSRPAATVEIDTHNLTKTQKKLLREAEDWLGTPYQYAAAEKGIGTDCSGMVMRVYLDLFGLKLPRNSAKQADFCTPLKEDDVTPGDLVFFATGKDKSKVSHVGIMLDSEKFIHASQSKGVVISSMYNPYYIRTFLMYGRIPHFRSDL